MSEPRSLTPSPNSGPRRFRHSIRLPRAGLVLAASVMACLLIAAGSTAAASLAPVNNSPVASAPGSVDYAPAPAGSPAQSAVTTAPPVAAARPYDRREAEQVAALAKVPAPLLAAELQRRGWIVMEP